MTKNYIEIRVGKGNGLKLDNGEIWMVRCFECGRENYTPRIASGYCAFCNYTPNKSIDDGEKKQ